MLINHFSLPTLSLGYIEGWHLYDFYVERVESPPTVHLVWRFSYRNGEDRARCDENGTGPECYALFNMIYYTGEVGLSSRGVDLTWVYSGPEVEQPVIAKDPHRERRKILDPWEMGDIYKGVGAYERGIQEGLPSHEIRALLDDLEESARGIARRYLDVWRSLEPFPTVLFMMYLKGSTTYDALKQDRFTREEHLREEP